MARSAFVVTLMLLAACAAQRPAQGLPTGTAAVRASPERQIMEAAARNADPDTVQVCEYEAVTGTHFPEWTCRYMNERERDRFNAQKYLLAPSPGGRPSN